MPRRRNTNAPAPITPERTTKWKSTQTTEPMQKPSAEHRRSTPGPFLIPEHGIRLKLSISPDWLQAYRQSGWKPGARFAARFASVWTAIPKADQETLLAHWARGTSTGISKNGCQIVLSDPQQAFGTLALCVGGLAFVFDFSVFDFLANVPLLPPADHKRLEATTKYAIAHELGHAFHFTDAAALPLPTLEKEDFADETAKRWGFPNPSPPSPRARAKLEREWAKQDESLGRAPSPQKKVHPSRKGRGTS